MDTLITLIALLTGVERKLYVLACESRELGFPTLSTHVGGKAAYGLRKQVNRLAADARRAGVEVTPTLPGWHSTLHVWAERVDLPVDADSAHMFVCAWLGACTKELRAREFAAREEALRELASLAMA
jgi:hypothetical protein